MLIDTHAHLNFNAYKNDVDEVIKRSFDNNVWMINVGSQYTTSKRAIAMADKHEKGLYAAVGLHPIHVEDGFDYEKYQELAKSPKVVAIGEIGLDYKSDYLQFKEKQRTVLCQQLNLAKELGLPIIFHCRLAHDDLIKIINKETRGVIHCFTGNWEQAKKYLEMGLYLGFNGIIFKPAPYRTDGSGTGLDLDEVIKKTPLDKILIETDCPYLTPPLPTAVLAKAGRNEPIFVKYVAEKIAKIKKLSYEEVAKITTKNAQKLFNI